MVQPHPLANEPTVSKSPPDPVGPLGPQDPDCPPSPPDPVGPPSTLDPVGPPKPLNPDGSSRPPYPDGPHGPVAAQMQQNGFHSIQNSIISFLSNCSFSVEPYLLSGELLDLYNARFGQKIMVRSEPSRNSVRLNFESSFESASAPQADWLTIIHLSPPNQISKSEFRVLNFSLSES